MDFIFVATCHSEFAAEIFYDNGEGASHVVGIDKGYTINDDAAITFAEESVRVGAEVLRIEAASLAFAKSAAASGTSTSSIPVPVPASTPPTRAEDDDEAHAEGFKAGMIVYEAVLAAVGTEDDGIDEAAAAAQQAKDDVQRPLAGL